MKRTLSAVTRTLSSAVERLKGLWNRSGANADDRTDEGKSETQTRAPDLYECEGCGAVFISHPGECSNCGSEDFSNVGRF